MNIVGLITEHNPFHNGHLYHVNEARKVCDADLVVSVMSGHFLQRGEPALFNKWSRARMAVQGGVDIVVELPAAFSTRSASAFAAGSVFLLNAMGIVTHVCFGSESGQLEELWPAARVLADEPPEFQRELEKNLDQGLPFPSARAKALNRYLSLANVSESGSELFGSPNNILGIEYLRSLLSLQSSIKPITIKRISAGYHDKNIDRLDGIASATSIREELLASGSLNEKISRVVPETSLNVIKEEISAGRGPVFLEDLAQILFYLLRTMTTDQVRALFDVSEGLENRIIDVSRRAESVRSLIEGIKTKRYTWTRIQRILTYILLGYTKEMATDFDLTGPRYIRVLGLSEKGRAIIKSVKKKAEVPVITITAPFLHRRDGISSMLYLDVRATDIYTLLYHGQGIASQGLDCKVMPFVAGK